MRKCIAIAIAVCQFIFVSAIASAKPAPNLSRVQITHIGADNTGWIPVSQIRTTTLYGQKFYIAVQFTGYPGQVFLYQNGTLIPPGEVEEPFGRTGIGNPYSGWVYQFAIPITYGNGAISVEAHGIKGGRHYNKVYGIKSEYQSPGIKQAN